MTTTKTKTSAKERVEEIRKQLTATVIEAIENDPGHWTKPWQAATRADIPHNPVSGTIYQGGNALWLFTVGTEYSSGRWATYRQWQSVGCQVRKGETSTPAVKWHFKYGCNSGKHKGTKTSAKEVTCGCGAKKIVWATDFKLFNADQVDGEAPEHPRFPLTAPTWNDDVEAGADRARAWFRTIGADWSEVEGDRAYYMDVADRIVTPEAKQFHTVGGFVATVAHEHVHWTGHSSRLDRDLKSARFGSEGYAFEELIAELGSVIVCNHLGLAHEPVRNHASYMKSWLKALKGSDGPSLLWKASTDASAASLFLIEEGGELLDEEPVEPIWEALVAA